ncbi:ligase-associated DNA damage response DEXH box helicase [Agaribacter flavus]|uniref:Ligase-associated DNA damage response DEXH box helicase n=1 Tax=Agaribacter flavus TaxID=1902781 RepID=A0ABV7FUB3_9ALTE
MVIPCGFQKWFAGKEWVIRRHQKEMLARFANRESCLLIAPTGAGKTLSGFLPSLIDLSERDKQTKKSLHTLYISPLKALTHDIERNLRQPISEIGLDIEVASRTGDTSAYQRQKQRKSPPDILLTTPESLMLMLSYADAPNIFSGLKCIILDEVHSFANTKRGDFTALAMARLHALNPHAIRFGLSATVAYPDDLAKWLGVTGKPCKLIVVSNKVKPELTILRSKSRMPFGGFTAKYAIKEIYAEIEKADTSLVFVNTRAQAELIFQLLWEENVSALPIAIYHGALSKEQRIKAESLMAKNQLKAIVATSALELGIDWGNVDLVIQVGAPKGICRLLQRIGRSNHTLDKPSRAILVPANRFEALECLCAIDAINNEKLDGEKALDGSLDIIPQFILNCLCSQKATQEEIYQQIRNAPPYQHLERESFQKLWEYTEDGGYALKAYDRYKRIQLILPNLYEPANKRVIARHRQNIGTIVEAGRMRVKRLRRKHQGKIIGEVEEYFAQQLVKGDTFYFAGEVLQFECIKDLIVEARSGKAKEPKIPSYVGGQMPLSTDLGEAVRHLLNTPEQWQRLPATVREWLALQQAYSVLPCSNKVLIEQFSYRQAEYTLYYTFEGRKANQTLGMLITKRMEKMGLKPLSFSVTDYGLSIASIQPVLHKHIAKVFAPDILGDELENWMLEAAMLKRAFRQVAIVSGLIEQQYHSSKKTIKQVTFSSDLLYDTLKKYDPDHVLLKVTRQEAERELLDLTRTANLLIRFERAYTFKSLSKPSPLAIPIVLGVRSERISGNGQQALLEQANLYKEAEDMMQDIRQLLENSEVQ